MWTKLSVDWWKKVISRWIINECEKVIRCEMSHSDNSTNDLLLAPSRLNFSQHVDKMHRKSSTKPSNNSRPHKKGMLIRQFSTCHESSKTSPTSENFEEQVSCLDIRKNTMPLCHITTRLFQYVSFLNLFDWL